MTQENPFVRNGESVFGEPTNESSNEAVQKLVQKFNTYVIEQYTGMRHFPGNCRTVSDIMEFDDCMNELDALKETGAITADEHKLIQGKMEELGRLTYEEMMERGEEAQLKLAA